MTRKVRQTFYEVRSRERKTIYKSLRSKTGPTFFLFLIEPELICPLSITSHRVSISVASLLSHLSAHLAVAVVSRLGNAELRPRPDLSVQD